MSHKARSIGRYQLVRRLGAGGAAEVWEATTPSRPGESFAFKLLRGAVGPDADGQRRFLAEARVGATLDHPHIVRTFEAGVDGGRAFLVMELLEGGTLAELKGPAPLPVGLVVALGRQLMAALGHAHGAAGPDGKPLLLVHRDVKPSNLFVTARGVLKLIDFGIATAPWLDRTVTRTGVLRGSLPYVSPEQARGEAVDPRSDLFSAGLVLHELLTGRRVFDQDCESAILTALLFGPIPSVRSRRPDAPEALADLVGRLTSRSPAERPATAAEAGDALAAAAAAWTEEEVARWVATRERASGAAEPGTFTITKETEAAAPAAPAPDEPARTGDTGGRPRTAGARSRRSARAGIALLFHLRVARMRYTLLAAVAILAAAAAVGWSRARSRPGAHATPAFAPPEPDPQPRFPVRAAFYYPPPPALPFLHGKTHHRPTTARSAKTMDDVLARDRAGLAWGKIQVAISSWRGPGSSSDRTLARHLAAWAGEPLRWTVYYEGEGYGNPSPERIAADLRYLGESYARHRGFFRVDGRFVVFVYHDLVDRCDGVERWRRANSVGAYIVLFAFAGYERCSAGADAWHDYAATPFHVLEDHSASVSPGLWPRDRAAPTTARDVERFRADVRRMVATPARFHLIVTFNEWAAGTAVDSADEWASPSGFGAYLDVLHTDGR